MKQIDIKLLESAGYVINVDGSISKGNKLFCYSANTSGYIQMKFYVNGKYHRLLVHRVVATKYCTKRVGCDYVNHKDGNRLNNAHSNLEWVNLTEKQLHHLGHTDYSKPIKAKALKKLGLKVKTIANILKVSKTTANKWSI